MEYKVWIPPWHVVKQKYKVQYLSICICLSATSAICTINPLTWASIVLLHLMFFVSVVLSSRPALLPGGRPHVVPQRVVDDGKGWEAAHGAKSPHAGQRAGQAETIQRGCQQVQRGRPAAENSPVQSGWMIREERRVGGGGAGWVMCRLVNFEFFSGFEVFGTCMSCFAAGYSCIFFLALRHCDPDNKQQGGWMNVWGWRNTEGKTSFVSDVHKSDLLPL